MDDAYELFDVTVLPDSGICILLWDILNLTLVLRTELYEDFIAIVFFKVSQ